MKSILVLIVMAVISAVAYAGYIQPAQVEVIVNPDGSGMASGDMVSARFSENDLEFIGCGKRAYSASSISSYGFCQARDANGVQSMCTVYDSSLVEGLDSIGDYSFILFTWNAAGECTTMGTSTQSFYMPDFRDKGTTPGASAPGRGR